LLLVLWLRSRGRVGGAARVLVVLLAVVPLFVAASRLYEGAHHLTDVGTSLVYGTIWLAAVAALTRPRSALAEPAVPRSARGDEHTPVPHR
jgi:membrane-associated phospholipid phosphatase